MNTTEVLQEAYRMVWNFRKVYKDKWPTPTPKDSVLYAVTEIAEAIDARLRLENPDHVRNNDRDESVLAELADAAIMLLTALSSDYKFNHNICGPVLGPVTLERVMQLACSCFGNSAKVHVIDIQYLLGIISQYPGMDLLPEIEGKLIKLERKLNAVKAIDDWMADDTTMKPDYILNKDYLVKTREITAVRKWDYEGMMDSDPRYRISIIENGGGGHCIHFASEFVRDWAFGEIVKEVTGQARVIDLTT